MTLLLVGPKEVFADRRVRRSQMSPGQTQYYPTDYKIRRGLGAKFNGDKIQLIARAGRRVVSKAIISHLTDKFVEHYSEASIRAHLDKVLVNSHENAKAKVVLIMAKSRLVVEWRRGEVTFRALDPKGYYAFGSGAQDANYMHRRLGFRHPQVIRSIAAVNHGCGDGFIRAHVQDGKWVKDAFQDQTDAEALKYYHELLYARQKERVY